MLQYLIILLDDTSTSFCHYKNEKTTPHLIPLETLKQGILFGMKENLMIQYILPDYELPVEYKEAMNSIDHHLIVPATCKDANALGAADAVVFNSMQEICVEKLDPDTLYALRTTKAELFANKATITSVIGKVTKLSISITDAEAFTDADFRVYEATLMEWAAEIERLYVEGKTPQLNLLTDRMMLQEMNNCGAGDANITLAPDGNFYVCPAFYQADSRTILGDTYTVGSLKEGLDIKNPQLYKLGHAPLCRNCDAYHCRRCIWLNRKTTLEVNTPSHEQCVAAHIERKISRELLANIRKHGTFMPETEIKEITYLDPFDVRKEW